MKTKTMVARAASRRFMLDKYEIHAGSNGEHLVTVEPCKIGDGATASYYGKPAKYEAVIVDKVVTFKPYPSAFGCIGAQLAGSSKTATSTPRSTFNG